MPYQIFEIERDVSDQYEQMGSKPKFWFTHPDLGLTLFKQARPGTGEDWAEKIAEQACVLLGLPHARYELAEWDGHRGIITPTIAPTLDKTAVRRLIHGNELLPFIIPEYQGPESARRYHARQHTLEAVLTTLNRLNVGLTETLVGLPDIQSAGDLFAGYILLDAWIGNTDRHHENWAVVDVIDLMTGQSYRHLAPTFDHGSSLGRNENDERRMQRLNTKDQTQSVAAYANKARSAFYLSTSDSRPMTTIEAFKHAIEILPDACRSWIASLSTITREQTLHIISEVPSERISDVSAEFVLRMMLYNQQSLLTLGEELL